MPSSGAKSAVIELESLLLKDEFRSSKDFLEKILHDDFLEIGASGKTYNKEQAIESLTGEANFSSAATDFRFFQIAEGVALLTYHLKTHSPDFGSRRSVRSSIWKLEENNWKLIFHQGSRIVT